MNILEIDLVMHINRLLFQADQEKKPVTITLAEIKSYHLQIKVEDILVINPLRITYDSSTGIFTII